MTIKSGLGFIDAPINRAAGLRTNKEWLQARLKDQTSRFVVFAGDRPLVTTAKNSSSVAYWGISETEKHEISVEPILLNLDTDSNAIFAVAIDDQSSEQFSSDDINFIDLRSLARQSVLPTSELGMLAQARSLLHWHSRHCFCANCGFETKSEDGGYRRYCAKCNAQHFPRVDPVVIMLIRHGDNFLLGRGKNFSTAFYSTLSGFVEPGETIEDAARRETFEETGINIGKVTYLMSQPWPFPSSLMIGVIGQAETSQITINEEELADARWFSVGEIGQMRNETHPEGFTLPSLMSIPRQVLEQIVME